MDELRALARTLLVREDNAQSLPATGLVLTALRRVAGISLVQDDPEGDVLWRRFSWRDRKHLLGTACRAMKQALVDHARKRKAKKRAIPVPLRIEDVCITKLLRAPVERPEILDALMTAFTNLQRRHPDWAEILDHRFLCGLTIDETAKILGKSEKTIRRLSEQARLLLVDDTLRIINDATATARD